MKFLKKLFSLDKKIKSIQKKSAPVQKKPPTRNQENLKIKFNFYILDENDPIPKNKWYQKAKWKNKSFVSYGGQWSSDWKYADDSQVKVAGLSRGDRSKHFVIIAQADDFRLYLEPETENPVNRHAKKVMASGTVNGKFEVRHIGYLPDEIATKYADTEIEISPHSAFLPTDFELNVGVKVVLLVRAARYLKKMQKGKA